MSDVRDFIINMYQNNGSFSYSPKNKISNLYSTCFGVLCLDLIGELKYFKDKGKLVSFIQNYQDKNEGYFIDNSVITNRSIKHNKKYVLLQLTDFAQLALKALDEKPLYPYKFLNQYKNNKKLVDWFYNLNWKDPWLASNEIMFILNCFIYENESKNKNYIVKIINLLNKNQDSKNGFWNLNNRVTYHNQMAGAYHFMFFYTYLNLTPQFVSKMIDSTLKIQSIDGLFNYSTGGGSCDDLDAVDILCRSTFYTNHKYEEISLALTKVYFEILKNQNDDGGFCWAKRQNNIYLLTQGLINLNLFFIPFDFLNNFLAKLTQIYLVLSGKKSYWAYSGIKSMKIMQSDSDLFSTWFRLTSLAFIEKTIPTLKSKKIPNWKLRKNSGLGFYR